jgi:hypothetical protein
MQQATNIPRRSMREAQDEGAVADSPESPARAKLRFWPP